MEDLKYEFYINATPAKVWKVLISPTETKKIFYGSSIESTFEIGSPLKYVGPGVAGDETIHIYGKVLEFQPNKAFTHTYNVGEAYTGGNRNFVESRVKYQIEQMGDCSKLTLVHDHWTEGDPTYENTAKGWWILLSSIKSLIETDKPLNLSVH